MSSNYNSRLKPAEVLWDGNKIKLIRRAETFEDLIKIQNFKLSNNLHRVDF
jgi:diaminopimelate decarboxylase